MSIKTSDSPADILIQNRKGAPVLVYTHTNGSEGTFRHLIVVERYKAVAPSHLCVHASERSEIERLQISDIGYPS